MTLRQAHDVAELELRWANLYAESAMLQYDITCSDVKTAVLTESASAEDAEYIMEGAIGDLASGIVESIKKIFEAIGKFLGEIGTKISTLFKKDSVKKQMDAIKDVQNDPEVKKATIEIDDIKDRNAKIDKYDATVARCRKKLLAGKPLTDADREALESSKKDCMSPAKKITIGVSAAALLTGAAITAVNTKKLSDQYSKLEKDYTDATYRYNNNLRSVMGKAGENMDAKAFAFSVRELAQAEAYVAKMRAQAELNNGNIFHKACAFIARIVSGYNGKGIRGIKNTIHGAGTRGPSGADAEYIRDLEDKINRGRDAYNSRRTNGTDDDKYYPAFPSLPG